MRYLHSVLIALFISLSPPAQSQPVADFSGWEVLDKGGRTMPYLGRPSLYLERGIALMPNSTFADGAIDFDVAIHGQSGFAGVVFRSQTPEDYELVYLRTHRSRQWDALQYTPIIRNQEAWQLYTGAGYNGVAELPANRWVHVRVVVEGYVARVFVDRATTPQLVVQDLKRPWAAGRVGLWGRSGAANFSNVTVTPADNPAPPRQPAPSVGAGVVSRWSLSQSFATDSISTDRLPDGLSWIDVPAESSGVVNIAQHRARVPASARGANDSGRDTVFAKAVLHASRAQRIRLAFGYSDDATVFLDGQPLFAGANGYLLRDGSALGTLTLADSLFVDLSAGRHELIFAVTEAFGGWGVAARIDGGADLTVELP